MHNRPMFAWDDLRFLLAVARDGSTLAAARALGVNQSTVHRRLLELERRTGLKLVVRKPSGYQLTEPGHALLLPAQAVAEAVADIERAVRAQKSAISGIVRLTCPEPIMERLTGSPLLALLAERHPGLRLEFVMSDTYLDLAKGEADIALRSGEPEDETLVGKKVATSHWAVYASASYVQYHGEPASQAELPAHDLIGFEGVLARHRAAKWLDTVAPGHKFAASNSSVLGVLHAVKSGIGIAPLPTTIADREPDLVQVLPPVAALERGWFLLAHPDLRQSPRVAAVIEFFDDEKEMLRAILMG